MLFPLSTLLRVLAASAASIPFVAAQTAETPTTPVTTDDLYSKISSTAPPPGFNVEGGSVFENFVNAYNNKQMFFLATGTTVFEKPGSEPASGTTFGWCGDLTFSDITNSSLMGYAGRCVDMFLGLGGYADYLAAGSQLAYDYVEGGFSQVHGISAVYVEQLNAFEGQRHTNTDDWVGRYWDDGRKTMPGIAWEGHDEGDMAANAATSSWSGFADTTWMTVEEVAQLFNTSVDEFTPAKFKQAYLNTWIKDHKEEEAEDNPNPEAELEIIEQVQNQNETDSTDETTAPAEPSTAEDGDTDPIDDSASGRKLASVAARFVSAALRVFGI